MDVPEFMVDNDIKSEIELVAIADEQKKVGKKDLANFALSCLTKALSDLLEKTWKMESANKKVFRSKQTRMKVIDEYSNESCADSCSGEWLNRALEVLLENNIYPQYLSGAVRKLLQMGRGKSRNIVIGRTNCAKTFLLKPFELLFDTFCAPSKNSMHG